MFLIHNIHGKDLMVNIQVYGQMIQNPIYQNMELMLSGIGQVITLWYS